VICLKTFKKYLGKWNIIMNGGTGEMKESHATSVNLDNLYTLDPQDDLCTNDEERIRMKKYLVAVMDEVLTKTQKRIVLIYYGEEKRTPEIATILGMNPRKVQRELKSAKEILNHYKNIFIKAT
jgi:DNA-directed RNA polymerase specialized sigma subunit